MIFGPIELVHWGAEVSEEGPWRLIFRPSAKKGSDQPSPWTVQLELEHGDGYYAHGQEPAACKQKILGYLRADAALLRSVLRLAEDAAKETK